MSDADRIAAFLKLADEEMEAARLLGTKATRQSAYLIQQAAEKAVRALLVRARIPFGTGHNLGQMAAALPAEHPLRETVFALDRLSPAATRHRYPSPSGHLAPPPSPQIVSSDIEEVDAFVRSVKGHVAS